MLRKVIGGEVDDVLSQLRSGYAVLFGKSAVSGSTGAQGPPVRSGRPPAAPVSA
jgi:hypothetical protein